MMSNDCLLAVTTPWHVGPSHRARLSQGRRERRYPRARPVSILAVAS